MKSDQYQISWDDEMWLKRQAHAGADPKSLSGDSQHEGEFGLYTKRAGESTAEGLGAMKANSVNQGEGVRMAENRGGVNDEQQQIKQQQHDKCWSEVEGEQPRAVSRAQSGDSVLSEPNCPGMVRGYDLDLGFVAIERPVNPAGVYRRPERALQAEKDEGEFVGVYRKQERPLQVGKNGVEFVGMDEYAPVDDRQGVNRQEVSRIINERLAELRVYVLESDITDAQQAVKSVVEQASF